jgi:hypothetical protein
MLGWIGKADCLANCALEVTNFSLMKYALFMNGGREGRIVVMDFQYKALWFDPEGYHSRVNLGGTGLGAVFCSYKILQFLTLGYSN